jgi:hypothetical protein
MKQNTHSSSRRGRPSNQRTGMSPTTTCPTRFAGQADSPLPHYSASAFWAATEKLGIVNFSPVHDETSDQQLPTHCYFGARLTAPWQQSALELFQVLIVLSCGLARLHQQITQQSRSGFADAAVSFAFCGGVLHRIEAHLSSYPCVWKRTDSGRPACAPDKARSATRPRDAFAGVGRARHFGPAPAATAPLSECVS